jgi:hypothetical protein
VNNQEPKANVSVRRIGWVMALRIFWLFFSIGVISLFCFFAPFLIGKYCGYVWGVLTGVAAIMAWFYLGRKIFLTPSTQIIWLITFAYVIFIAIFELTRLFH